jgi:hypothetical protein
LKRLLRLGDGLPNHSETILLILDVSCPSFVLFGSKVLYSFALIFDFDEAEGGGGAFEEVTEGREIGEVF